MIPFQTLLALLAALVLMSCSQEAPPGARARDLKGNAKTEPLSGVSPSPTVAPLVIHKDPTITVKPDKNGEPELNPETSVMKIDVSNPKQLTFAFVGLDAQRWYQMTEIEPKLKKLPKRTSLQSQDEESDYLEKSYVKSGEHFICSQNGLGDYACALTLTRADGDVAQVEDPKKVKSGTGYATFRPKKQVVGTYLSFNANVPKEKEAPTPYFQINFFLENAKQIFDALQAGDVEGRKRGKRINCQRDLKQDPQSASAYSCILYGNLNTGSFDEIQP